MDLTKIWYLLCGGIFTGWDGTVIVISFVFVLISVSAVFKVSPTLKVIVDPSFLESVYVVSSPRVSPPPISSPASILCFVTPGTPVSALYFNVALVFQFQLFLSDFEKLVPVFV